MGEREMTTSPPAAGPVEVTAASTWRRLCPLGDWRDPVLEAVEECLAAPDTAAALERAVETGSYPAEVVAELQRRGLARLFAEAPGDELSRVTAYHLSALNELAARYDGSLAITLGVNALALLPVYIGAGDELLAEVFGRVRRGAFASLLLSEREHGSNLTRNRARAEPGTLDGDGVFRPAGDGDGRSSHGPPSHYRLHGRKDFINGGARHQLLVALLRTADHGATDDGPLGAARDFTLFLVERGPGVEAERRWRTLPTPAADISSVGFAGVVVPATKIVGRPDEGFPLIQKTLSLSRGAIGALATGAAERAGELAFEHARRRDIYGGPILGLDAIADHLMRQAALERLAAAASLKSTAVTNALGLGAAYYTAVAKYVCCAAAEEAVDEGRRVLAAHALLVEYPYQRLVRDVLLYGVFDGTSHLMLEQIQWRLEQLVAARGTDRAAADPLAAAGEIYRTPPRRILEVCRRPARPLMLSPEAGARALAERPGSVPAEPLAEVAGGLLDLVGRLREDGRWEKDQGLRFTAADLLARLEAVLALVELGDPGRREALGLAPVEGGPPWEGDQVRFAAGWSGALLAAVLRRLALSVGVEPAADLAAAERELVALQAAARAGLLEAWRAETS